MSTFTVENEAFAELVKYGTVAVLKMVAMSLLTVAYRVKHKAFLSEEDVVMNCGTRDKDEIKKKMAAKCDDVERVRSAQQNDIENIVPFVLLALLYVSTNPNPRTAGLLFKAFAATRIVHSVAYVLKLQPWRSLSFGVGIAVNITMALSTLCTMWC